MPKSVLEREKAAIAKRKAEHKAKQEATIADLKSAGRDVIDLSEYGARRPTIKLNLDTAGAKIEAEHVLDDLLATHSIVNIEGRVRVAYWKTEPGDCGERLQLISTTDFRTFYSNCRVLERGSDGEMRRKPVSEVFQEKATRYDGVVLAPGAGAVVDQHLNLWRGWGVEPRPGDWSLMRAHIENVLAGGEARSADYIIKWSAWTLQNGGLPAEVALVFRGGKGTGKGTFGRAMHQLFGTHGLHISDSEHLTGKFNKHLMYCCLLFADEAFWAGDKKGEGQLKRLITEPRLLIEPKGIDAFEVRNQLHIIMASNNDWVVPASHDERRYAVFDVSGAYAGDRAYFTALQAELDGGGLAAMLHDLLAMDLGDWHPRQDIPDTEALREQKLQSMRGIDAIVYQMALEGHIPYAVPGKPGIAETSGEYGGKGFWGYCKAEQPELRYESGRGLAAKFYDWGFTSWRNASTRGLQAPPLDELREAIERRYGPQSWPERDDWGGRRKPRLSLVDIMDRPMTR